MEQAKHKPIAGWLSILGLASGTAAILAASCCVLPLVLGGLGLGAWLLSSLEVLADYQKPILFSGIGLIAVAWFVYFRRGGVKGTVVVLAVASGLVMTAASWGVLERPLLKMVRANR